VLAALIPLAAGCNQILGIKEHQLADGGSAGTGGSGTAGSGTAGDSGAAGMAGGAGTGGVAGATYGCGVDGAVTDADEADASAPMPSCGFVVPTFGAGLPTQATYKPNTDQTVTDNITKLTWEGVVYPSRITQSEAATYCAGLDNSNGPWRLPTLLELISLVDYTVPSPGPTISAMFPSRPAERFWTSSRAACGAPQGWWVDFGSGAAHPISDNDASGLYRVRCVRGAPPNCPSTRYSFPGNGTVHDATTGLTWWRTVEPAHYLTWTDATTFCPTTLGTGWRLPSVAEMETIVDLTRQDPSIDLNVFPETPDAYFWSSAPFASDPSNAWYVAFIHGHVDKLAVSVQRWVRCVRWDGP
jgi:hypothetical protein